MASPPFNIDQTAPAANNFISAYPTTEQTFRDIVESWLLLISTNEGVLRADALPDELGTDKVFTTDLKIDAVDTNGNASVTFRDESDVVQARMIWDESDDTLSLIMYADDGTTPRSTIVLAGDTASGFSYDGVPVVTVASPAENDIIVRGPTAWVRKAKGTALQFLRMNSDATALEWAAVDWDPKATLVASQASTSGTAINFTDIPSWVNKISVFFDNVGPNVATDLLVRIGDSGGLETTSYVGSGGYFYAGDNVEAGKSTTGFIIATNANPFTGLATITRMSGNKWIFAYSGALPDADGQGAGAAGGGSKTLSATLDRFSVVVTSGAFNSGNIAARYEA